VLADRKPESLGDRVLTLLDPDIHKLFDMPTVETQDVIVMWACTKLEYRHPIGKMVTSHETR